MIRALLVGCQFTREVVGADAQPVIEVEAVGGLSLTLHTGVQVQLLAAESRGLFHEPAHERVGVSLATARLAGDRKGL